MTETFEAAPAAPLAASEAVVRRALHAHAMDAATEARRALHELWVPRSNERADVAVIGRLMHGFEIKTDRDTLKRLPRQIVAYGRVFDRCTAVVAGRHLEGAEALLPAWWGITAVHVSGRVTFTSIRVPRRNPAIDREVLVRLLWRDEAMVALLALGRRPQRNATRVSLWTELLRGTSTAQLKAAVRQALVTRDPTRVRMPTRPFAAALAPGQ